MVSSSHRNDADEKWSTWTEIMFISTLLSSSYILEITHSNPALYPRKLFLECYPIRWCSSNVSDSARSETPWQRDCTSANLRPTSNWMRSCRRSGGELRWLCRRSNAREIKILWIIFFIHCCLHSIHELVQRSANNTNRLLEYLLYNGTTASCYLHNIIRKGLGSAMRQYICMWIGNDVICTLNHSHDLELNAVTRGF